ncbi:DUF2515 family protein [Paenibacillus sp. IITD108]|uniref:DUF2515 family protein n=1 Tax=Paenibacillus sp. IITD108 TaxID=3116649 RepID=UPI002F411F07
MFFTRKRQITPLETIRKQLKKKMNHSPSVLNKLTFPEMELLNQIRQMTQEHNLNNVTRTKAYLEFYLRHPEIHWAFLGHMVSRNGGWNMTDLKGEFLGKLLSRKEQESFFHFLERGNWLIFQDIYPQFLLYEESLKQNRPMFYLFPQLNISMFLETIWDYFWSDRDTYILCIASIINEQSYLEQRVVQHPHYQKEVFNKIEFHLQNWLPFNQILFPSEGTHVKGQTLQQFQLLHERISLGKRLYAVLFKNTDFHRQALDWAKCHPHTGSRKDYWPHLFNDVNEGVPGIAYPLRLKSCQLRKGARRIYSPKLEHVWKNVSQPEAEPGDWFHDISVVDYLDDDLEMMDGEIKIEYCKTLEWLEVAALAKKAANLF